MKTCIKKIVLLTLGLALILSLCIPKPIMKEAQAKPIVKTAFNYVALGDSVSFGMSATQYIGYPDLLSDYIYNLHRIDTINYTNSSNPGDTSTNLFTQISHNDTAIENADFITINIGGNNLLGPLIAAIPALAQAFGVETSKPGFEAELAAAIKVAMENEPDETNMILQQLLFTHLAQGVETFAADFPMIINKLKTLAPNAEIFVNTIYNPFDEQDPFYQIFNPLFDPLIIAINQTINGYKQRYDYNVVDVYGEFSNYTGNETLVDFNVATGSLDPHPTDAGHELIFKAHLLPGIKGKINRYVGYRHKK